MRPVKARAGANGLFAVLGFRYQWLEADPAIGGTTKGFGVSAAFGWQDNAPHLKQDRTTDLGRWHTRYGVEFAPRNALVTHDYGAFFGRWRDHHTGEYTFLAGSESNGQFFVGLNVSTYFR